MTVDIWVISDTHHNHDNILKFTKLGSTTERIRPEFEPYEMDKMNETIIYNWNSVVKPKDKVYHLGDVGSGKEWLTNTYLHRLNGRKRLIMGNHDNYGGTFYDSIFEKVMESRRFGGVLLSHRPALIGSTDSKVKCNIHGHIHEKVINDQRYFNVSVEQIKYTPVNIEDLFALARKRGLISAED